MIRGAAGSYAAADQPVVSEFGFQFDRLLAKFDLRRTFKKVIAALARSVCMQLDCQTANMYVHTYIYITHM